MTSGKKLFEGKTLAILTGGGDTPALNATIEAIRNRAVVLGYRVAGIRRGWKGLLGDGDLVDITFAPFDVSCGGTVLRSSRTNPFAKGNEKRREEVLRNIRDYDIDVLVVAGGDDTLGAARKLYDQEGIPVIGFPKTIDNDLRTQTLHEYSGSQLETAVCPGFPTAAQSVVDYTQRIKTYAQSHERILVLEVMGREAGWLTGAAAYAGADFALVPEAPVTKKQKQALIEKIAEKYKRAEHGYLLVAVAEGTQWYHPLDDKPVYVHASSERDEFGHPAFGGVSGVVAADIKKKTGLPAKGVVTGFYVRSGSCGDTDRKLVNTLADKVQDLLLRQCYGRMPVIRSTGGAINADAWRPATVDLPNVVTFPLPGYYYDKSAFNFSPAYMHFMDGIIERNQEVMFDFPFQQLQKSSEA